MSLEDLIGNRDPVFNRVIRNNINDIDIKIKTILNVNKKEFYKFLSIFNKKYVRREDITQNIIEDRYEFYINEMKVINSTQSIINSIQLLYIFHKTYYIAFSNLNELKLDHKYILSPIDPNIALQFNNFLEALKIESPESLKKELDIGLHRLIKNMIRLKAINDVGNTILYGSFPLYLYNQTIEFKDIDFYCSNSFFYLITLMGMIYFVTGNEISIVNIPYVPGLITIRDESVYEEVYGIRELNILDCTSINKSIFDKIPSYIYNGCRILSPFLMLMLNIRMYTVIQRRQKLSNNFERSLKTISTIYRLCMNLENFSFKTIKLPEYRWRYYDEERNLFQDINNFISNSYINYPLFFETNIEGITYVLVSNVVNKDSIIKKLYPTLTKKSMTFGSLYFDETYESDDNLILIINSSNEIYMDKNMYLTNFCIIFIYITFAIYERLHNRQDRAYNAANVAYTLMKHKSNISYRVINRPKLEGTHISLNFKKRLYCSIKQKKETSEYYYFNNFNDNIIESDVN